jgi:hypothetical protein
MDSTNKEQYPCIFVLLLRPSFLGVYSTMCVCSCNEPQHSRGSQAQCELVDVLTEPELGAIKLLENTFWDNAL